MSGLSRTSQTTSTQSTTSTTPTTTTTSSGVIMKRSKVFSPPPDIRSHSSSTISGLDLAESPRPLLKSKLKSPLEISRLALMPVESHQPVTPLAPDLRTQINKSLNKVTKKQISEVIKSKDETALSKTLSKSIDPVLKGLRHVSGAAARTLYNDLKYQGKTLTIDKINTLLTSDNPLERNAGVKALKALSKLCKNEHLVNASIRGASMHSSLTSHLSSIQLQTQFIKSARAMLTTSFFQNILSKDLQTGIGDLGLNADGNGGLNINNYLANVGFNRLMSENNFLGASLSSDVDFKLVLDDVQLKHDLMTNGGMNDQEATEAIQTIKQTLRDVLDASKVTFEESFDITLEVEDFTVKTISALTNDARTNLVEQNFLATVLHNHSFMSGSEAVKDKFIGLIQENLNFTEIGIRNFNQNLGDTDKGSIKVIKQLPALQGLLNTTSEQIVNNDTMNRTVRNIISSTVILMDKLKHEPGVNLGTPPNIDNLSNIDLDKFLKKPNILNIVLKGGTVDKLALQQFISTNQTIQNSSSQVGLFSDSSVTDKIGLASKLMKTFTKSVGGQDSSAFIGSPTTLSGDNWIFSVKYAGCRLNDMLDMVPKSVYCMSDGRDVGVSLKIYSDVQTIAESINSFSIQLQNRTYEAATARGEDHEAIDHLYDRITADEFGDMLTNASSLAKIKTMVDNLVSGLGSTMNELIGDDVNKIKEVQSLLNSTPLIKMQSKSPEQLRELGHKLFNALFNIADKASGELQPLQVPRHAREVGTQTV